MICMRSPAPGRSPRSAPSGARLPHRPGSIRHGRWIAAGLGPRRASPPICAAVRGLSIGAMPRPNRCSGGVVARRPGWRLPSGDRAFCVPDSQG